MSEEFYFNLTMARSLYYHMAVCVPAPDFDYEEGLLSFNEYGTKVAMALKEAKGLSDSQAVDLAIIMIKAPYMETAEAEVV